MGAAARHSAGRPESRSRRTHHERPRQSRRHPLEFRGPPGGCGADAQGTRRSRRGSMPVVVVTDSSSRLPDDLRRKWGIRQVPLHILLDDADLRDGIDEVPDDVHLRPGATTAAATPAELAEVYRQALNDSGGDGVVAVHLSAALSGTVGAAEATAAEIGPAIRVV